MLDRGQLEEFAERGFLLLPQAVPAEVVAAAAQAIDELIQAGDPAGQGSWLYNYFPAAAQAPELAALLTGSPAFGLAEALSGAGRWEFQYRSRSRSCIPAVPAPARPAAHRRLPARAGRRPGTFTMLAGVLMSSQRGQDAGNLWCGQVHTWPTPRTSGPAVRTPSSLRAATRPSELPEPEQVTGEAGDLLLAHYLLGHNIGANTSSAVRRAAYFRVKRAGHDPRWREFLTDPWLDYEPVRDVLG